MQSAIAQMVTGKTVLEYLRPRLLEPQGITDPKWRTSPQGINVVWDKLLPAMKPSPLSENADALAKLKTVLLGLELKK